MVVNFAVLLKCISVGHTLDTLNFPVKDLSFERGLGLILYHSTDPQEFNC